MRRNQMKKRFLTAFLSVMMVVCLSVSATALLASAAAVPDDDTYTTNVDLTDKSNFKGVFAGSGNKVIAGEADEIWDFDTATFRRKTRYGRISTICITTKRTIRIFIWKSPYSTWGIGRVGAAFASAWKIPPNPPKIVRIPKAV